MENVPIARHCQAVAIHHRNLNGHRRVSRFYSRPREANSEIHEQILDTFTAAFDFDLFTISHTAPRRNFLSCRAFGVVDCARERSAMALRIALPAPAMLLGMFAAAAAETPSTLLPPPGTGGSVSVDGKVRTFILTPRGRVDGLLLVDGTEVHFSPLLSEQIIAAVRPGDEVHVQGRRSRTPGVIAATALTDGRSGRSVLQPATPPAATGHQGSRPAPGGTPPTGGHEATVQGRVLQTLHDSSGAVNGALLGDGLELRLPDSAAAPWLVDLFQPGERVAAEGCILETSEGRVMAVQAIGSLPDDLTPIAPAPKTPPQRQPLPSRSPVPGVVTP
jgi:hypothetical protein